jgi:hypothetical protein
MSPAHRRALSFALAPFLLALPAAAQGSNTCSTATPISGTGTFPFSNIGATTDGPATCGALGADVWFDWTAPSTDSFQVTTCGGASFDTVIAVYSGSSCVGTELGCNDDSCGVQSVVGFNATAAGVYKIRIGGFAGATGSGTFSVAVYVPPPPCGGNTGPDVIVGDVLDVLNVSPFNGYDAIALGTASCNMGDQVVNWIGGTADHPVIRQNLYRYKVVDGASRFEQVGMSWLKHGFASLQDSLCCTCQPGGDGQHLGVGCSDPYGAGLNGSQPGLGPNWQVNAHTGVFTYPPANPSHGSDTIYRRCQILLSDLEVTGGGNPTRFFGECQYVTRDDAAAGNQNNNASWRELTCSGSPTNYTLALTGMTHREESAIRQWAQIDPGVHLSDIQVPNDGLIVLGTRATSLGGGQWRYEYAVYNMNADRDVGTFSVPVDAGVNVTHVEFHDVGYHDGDGPGNVNFSGVDWPFSRTGNAIAWATQTEVMNPSANAIRWGTQYNFRFDADAPPQTGTITLGLWRTGSPAAVPATGDVPGGSPISSFCFGDGTGAPCPCGNSGAPGRGCENSDSTGGAHLVASGAPALSGDSLVLTSSGERATALSLFMQGDLEIAPVAFGDGLRCTAGNLKRLYAKNAAGGSASAPTGADPSVSARSAALGDPIPAMGTRLYQVHYRDPLTAFCPDPPGGTFNVSNGLRVVWGP